MSKPRVLFVCVGNSCRSQIAEAFGRAAGLDAASAGTEPAASVSRTAKRVMEERGVPIDGHPKLIDWDALSSYDRVITMGCGVAESCPSLKTDEDWGLDDPVGRDIDFFRTTRDEIEARVADLARRLQAAPA